MLPFRYFSLSFTAAVHIADGDSMIKDITTNKSEHKNDQLRLPSLPDDLESAIRSLAQSELEGKANEDSDEDVDELRTNLEDLRNLLGQLGVEDDDEEEGKDEDEASQGEVETSDEEDSSTKGGDGKESDAKPSKEDDDKAKKPEPDFDWI